MVHQIIDEVVFTAEELKWEVVSYLLFQVYCLLPSVLKEMQ